MSQIEKATLVALAIGLSPSGAVFAQGYQPQNYAQGNQWAAAPGLAAPQVGMPNGAPGAYGGPPGTIVGTPGMDSANVAPGQQGRPMLPILPGGTGSNAAQIDPNMWQNMMKDRVNAGVILTGFMEEQISSKKSKIGDVFGIVLNQGYTDQNGNLQIPVGARIVGSVSKVVPAKYQRNGMPGTMDISLQSLVLPDGRTGAFYGMIQYDPNQTRKKDPNSSSKSSRNSIPLGSYASSLGSSGLGVVTSASRLVGWRYSPRQRMSGGKDLTIAKDEAIAVKLTKPLELAKFTNPANPAGGNAMAGTTQGYPGQPQGYGQAPNGAPGYPPAQNGGQMQGMSAPSARSLNEPF